MTATEREDTRPPRKRVLFVCHNHPSVRPGGAENYAYELFESFESSERFEPVFLAKGGKPLGFSDRPHEGTVIAPVGARPNDYFYFTDGYHYDWLNGSISDKDFYTDHLGKVLVALRPDVVHFQHTIFLGYDVLRLVRNVLPDTAIVYTLHEYAPICHRDGQMLRVRGNELCEASSPRLCHECFPEFTAQQFFLRSRRIQSHFGLVDRFIAPSQFLRQRYIDWGIADSRIVFEENGRHFPCAPAVTQQRRHRDRFAFFGQISPYKGLEVLLDAMRIIRERARPPAGSLFAKVQSAAGESSDVARPHLAVHGANLELQPGPHQDRIRDLLEITSDSVTMMGRYDWRRLDRLMEAVDWVVLPSIWWENSPLVIQEAFFHGRPVICSDIGGMAEKVKHGVDGLHFRARDARDLARVLEAATTEGLWDHLRAGIGAVHRVEAHRERLSDLYEEVLAERGRATGRELIDVR
ncbi:MAG TPA: glycosyltransferase family 4 protein [Acidimicrobiales bacterium]|nr:glycosyltransferase family 4 protein [Acidimicrobiales bacterium]